jgi:hypothetical protein
VAWCKNVVVRTPATLSSVFFILYATSSIPNCKLFWLF